ncbi:hypothetical protein V2J09_001289 [Rumex salicifolius]
MGVQGLWDLLSPVGRRVSVETLAGKRLAIDASIWMIQFMKAMRDDRGEMVKNAHLLGFFRRICKLLFLRIKPVFVFDGGTPILKRRTVIARRRQRENAQTKLRKTAEKLLLNQLKTTRLKELAKELEEQRNKNHDKGKNVPLSEPGHAEINDAHAECTNQEKIDEMLAASLAAEERDMHNTGASTSFNSLCAQDGGPSTSFISLRAQYGGPSTSSSANLMTTRLKDLAKEPEEQRNKKYGKGKNVPLSEAGHAAKNDARADCINQEKIDEMLAASLAAEDREMHTTGASTSFNSFRAQDGPSTSASANFMDDPEDEDEDDEEMILPITNGNIDPTVLAALPPSMQLDLLAQMRERLMAENRQKYQKVKKAPQKFSELQIETYLKTVAFRREIDMVQKAASGKGVGGLQTARIASEANKEFIFSSSFTGDKHALASAGLKKTAENQDGPELEHSTPTTTPASAVTPSTVSVSSGNEAPPSSGNETREDFGSDVQTYRDERGHMRVSRLRAMGIRMTRDLQRNLDLMKEMEQDMITADVPVKDPINPAEKAEGSNKITRENFCEVSGEKSLTIEKQDKDRPMENMEMSLEISFEDGGQCISVDDDDFFAHLVAGDPVPISSVGDTVSKDHNLESDSDVEWEDGNIGMQFDQVKSDVNESQLEESNDGETELQWEDGVSEIPEDAQTKSRGSNEEEAALQEAIKRSLEDLKDDMDASKNMESGNKVISLVSEAPNQNNKIAVPKNRLIDSSISGTALSAAMDKNKSSDIVCSPEMMPLPSADKSCQKIDTDIDSPCENCGHSDAGWLGERGLSIFGNSVTKQSNAAGRTIEKSYKALSDVPGESSCSTLHSQITNVALADPPVKKTSQNAEVVSPILHPNVNDASNVAINLEKPKDPAFDADMNRIASEEQLIHGVDTREQNLDSVDIEDDKIEAAEAHLEDELQILDEEYGNLEDEQRKLERNAASVNSEMFVECQELLQMFGLPYIIAPMEAEAQCAYMELEGLVEGVVTDDSDVFLFGARSVYKNIFDDRKYVETYLMKDIENELGLSREKLIRIAMLLGSDYTEGISGIGIVNAIEVVNAFPEEDGLSKFRKWIESPDPTILGKSGRMHRSSSKKKGSKSSSMNNEKTKDEHELDNIPKITQIFMDKHRKVSKNWHIPSSFPCQAVISAYDSPQVDKSTDPCSWGKPDLSVLRRLCWEKFGWASQKADDLLLPVLNEYNKRETQLRLEAFYSFNERFAKIRSKRVKQAVKGITGNESVELSSEPKVGGKRNKRKKPTKDADAALFEEEENLTSIPEEPRKSKTRRENFPSEKEQNSESLLEKKTESHGGPRATARARRKAQIGGGRKRKGTTDIEFSDAESSDDEQEPQFEKVEAPDRVRRSTRPRKAAKYAESDDEFNQTTQPVCDASEEENPRDENFNIDDSACFSEMRQCTAKDSVPDKSLCGDYLFKGGGFCADDEDEPGNEIGTLQDNSTPVEGDSHYLETGGGFCFDDSDAHYDSQNYTHGETKCTLKGYEDNGGQMCSSSTPSQGALDSVKGNGGSNSSASQQKLQQTQNVTASGKAISEVKVGTISPMKGLSAMPYLRRKRKKNS